MDGPICCGECQLAHSLRNKLGIILWTCDVLSKGVTDPEVLARLRTIHGIADAMVDEINKPLSRGTGV